MGSSAQSLKCFLWQEPPPSTTVLAGPCPFMVKSNDGRDVPVVQAFAFGKYLAYLKVTFDKAGNVIKADGNPILMDSSIPQGNSLCFSNCTQIVLDFGAMPAERTKLKSIMTLNIILKWVDVTLRYSKPCLSGILK